MAAVAEDAETQPEAMPVPRSLPADGDLPNANPDFGLPKPQMPQNPIIAAASGRLTLEEKVDSLITRYAEKMPGKRDQIEIVDTLGRKHVFRAGGFLNVLAYSIDTLSDSQVRSLHALPWFDPWLATVTKVGSTFTKEKERLEMGGNRKVENYESILPAPTSLLPAARE